MLTTSTDSGRFHAVKFYKDAESLADIVCAFLADGLRQGEPALLIATPEHLHHFRRRFTATGVDVDAAIVGGTLTVLDAAATLDAFMRDGVPMPELFADTMTPIFNRIAGRHPAANVRAYGEMVDVLWRQQQSAAALGLEMLWNDLARAHRFGLLCGYAMGNFYKGAATDDICGVHSHVVSDAGSAVSLT